MPCGEISSRKACAVICGSGGALGSQWPWQGGSTDRLERNLDLGMVGCGGRGQDVTLGFQLGPRWLLVTFPGRQTKESSS